MSIQTINPTSGEVLETFEPYNERQINEALEEALSCPGNGQIDH